MQISNINLIAGQVRKDAFKTKTIFLVWALYSLLCLYAAYSGYAIFDRQNDIRIHYQTLARESWENNPDKHPHRMAHFGSFAFRLQHPLSLFDFGIEKYVGNAVFLEAHKQNTVNFSEAGFSTGLLRFGEISLAMLLQLMLPLILFFIGFAVVAGERENGTLKVLLSQGASWSEILLGKSLGIMQLALFFCAPAVLLFLSITAFSSTDHLFRVQLWPRTLMVLFSSLIYLWIISVATVLVSAFSQTAKDAILRLLGIWLLFTIVLPKTTQSLGAYLFPSPSKVQFDAIVEQDLIRQGDSHNPDDPHYQALKDSLLQAYQVATVEELPFNYSGFIMQEGERISSAIYNRHKEALVRTYQKQNAFAAALAWVNPYTALKNISSAFCGTGFDAYLDFQSQAEDYRYQLAQEMNALQIKLISNRKLGEAEQPYRIDRSHWEAFPDFKYHFLPFQRVFGLTWVALTALAIWLILSFVLVFAAVRYLQVQ